VVVSSKPRRDNDDHRHNLKTQSAVSTGDKNVRRSSASTPVSLKEKPGAMKLLREEGIEQVRKLLFQGVVRGVAKESRVPRVVLALFTKCKTARGGFGIACTNIYWLGVFEQMGRGICPVVWV